MTITSIEEEQGAMARIAHSALEAEVVGSIPGHGKVGSFWAFFFIPHHVNYLSQCLLAKH